MDAAEEFVSGWTFEDFSADRKTQFRIDSMKKRILLTGFYFN
jgi:hypothetical protein